MSTNVDIMVAARQFMERVSLSGKEVPAFNSVVHWLESEIERTGSSSGGPEPDGEREGR